VAKFPDGQGCKNCTYGEDRPSRPIVCVRYPPIRLANDDTTGKWPDTLPEYWCGEWAPADPKTFSEAATALARLVILGDRTGAYALRDKLDEERTEGDR
jgi:hypothetical protein